MLIGYAITAAVIVSLISLIVVTIYDRKELRSLLSPNVNKLSLVVLLCVVAFFIIFSLLFVAPSEQLYFDENIYQGIALNILHHGNALWCQYGTGYLRQCYSNSVYHDPVGSALFLAIAFWIFGVSTGTAYGLELLIGVLSIVAVFLLASVVLDRKNIAIFSATIFALMPELFIWSRTQSDFDLPFMMLSIFAFFFFAVYAKRPNSKTLSIFLFSLLLTVYARMEAILLLGPFLILYFTFGGESLRKTFGERMHMLLNNVNNNPKFLALIIIFVMLLLPQLYYISLELQNPDYNQANTSQQLFSITNFLNNGRSNLDFLAGGLNGVSYYPAQFPPEITLLAIIGLLLFTFDKKYKNRLGIILLLLLWFFVYFIFYSFFYAGSAAFGVDSRFLLQLLPSLSLLAALGVYELAVLSKHSKFKVIRYATYCIVIAALIFYPFISALPILTITQQNMPQQHVIAPALNFIYGNYGKVPQNCLVFSFTPDVWYALNRSSAQIGYLGNSNGMSKNYSCFVFDYGYWCVVPSYHSTTCQDALNRYSLSVISTDKTAAGYNTTLYRINNYS